MFKYVQTMNHMIKCMNNEYRYYKYILKTTFCKV